MPNTLTLNGSSNAPNGNGNITTAKSSSKKVPNPDTEANESSNPGSPLTLPPDFTPKKYAEFISAVQPIVGENNVTLITDAAQLIHEHYTDPSKAHDMHNVVDKTYFVASAVVCPRDVKDVQDIMRLCNQFEMPVWPFSIGRK
jgi:hypothetical protein